MRGHGRVVRVRVSGLRARGPDPLWSRSTAAWTVASPSESVSRAARARGLSRLFRSLMRSLTVTPGPPPAGRRVGAACLGPVGSFGRGHGLKFFGPPGSGRRRMPVPGPSAGHGRAVLRLARAPGRAGRMSVHGQGATVMAQRSMPRVNYLRSAARSNMLCLTGQGWLAGAGRPGQIPVPPAAASGLAPRRENIAPFFEGPPTPRAIAWMLLVKRPRDS